MVEASCKKKIQTTVNNVVKESGIKAIEVNWLTEFFVGENTFVSLNLTTLLQMNCFTVKHSRHYA